MKAFVVILCMLLSFSGFSQETANVEKEKEEQSHVKSRHYPFNLSLFYPVSINRSQRDSVNINLTLIYGRVGRVSGVDLALLATVVDREVRGVQLAGLVGVGGNRVSGLQAAGLGSVAGDRMRGLQLGGLFTVVGERGKGVQGSGIFAVVGEDMTGIQSAGIFAVTGETLKGIQSAGIFGVVGEDATGIQAAGIFCVTGERFRGFQAAAIAAIAGDELSGVQAAIVTIAPFFKGVQVGVINICDETNGVQIGVVNYAKNKAGTPIGMVNLSREGRIRMVAWGSNIMGLNLGVRFLVNKVYSILSLGGINVESDISASLSYSWHYGLRLPLGKFKINTDLGYGYVDNETFFRGREGNLDQHMLQMRGWLEWELTEKFSIIGGLGLNYMWDYAARLDSGAYSPLFMIGIEVL